MQFGVLVGLIFLFFVFTLLYNFSINGEQQFIYLADSFLHGQLHFREMPGTWWGDTTFANGRYYWPLGPFPALILMPFVLIFGTSFLQGFLQFFLTLFNFYLLYKIALKINYKKLDALWLALAFVFASVYLGAAWISFGWQFAEIFCVLLQLMSIYEFLNRKRYCLIGIYSALLFATRPTAGLGIVFFILAVIFSRDILKEKIKKLTFLLGPTVIVGALLLIYNYLRLGSFWNNGYMDAILGSQTLISAREKFGLFKLRNIPTNLYYYFLKMPEPVLLKGSYLLKPPYLKVSPWGLSFFVMSPIFLWMFKISIKEKITKYALLTSAAILFFLLAYWGTGYVQLGPRYILDLLPFAFLAMLYGFKEKKLNWRQKLVISISCFTNLFFFFTLYAI